MSAVTVHFVVVQRINPVFFQLTDTLTSAWFDCSFISSSISFLASSTRVSFPVPPIPNTFNAFDEPLKLCWVYLKLAALNEAELFMYPEWIAQFVSMEAIITRIENLIKFFIFFIVMIMKQRWDASIKKKSPLGMILAGDLWNE